MNEYTAELSEVAQADIEMIFRYIRDELQNEVAAKKFAQDTREAVDSLECYPYSHGVRPTTAKVSIETRQYNYRENYCILYVIKEEEKVVRISRVTYSHRDLDTLIRDFTGSL